MPYTHKEILAKHQKIHDSCLDELEAMTEPGSKSRKGVLATQTLVEREWALIMAIEERMQKRLATDETDEDSSVVLGWEDIADAS